MAAEEKRKKREQMKILKQQVRILRFVHCLNFPSKASHLSAAAPFMFRVCVL